MFNCPSCGSKMNQGDSFCNVCGFKVGMPQGNGVGGESQIQQVQPINSQVVSNQMNNQVNGQMNNQIGNQMNNQANSFGSSSQGFNDQVNNFNNTNNVSTNNNMIDDQELIDAYIKKNVYKLNQGGFSWCTFLFGFIYALYRKMWALGFGWFVFNMIINYFLPSVATYITLLTGILMSINFKKYYLDFVKDRVTKIKESNPGKDHNQLKEICSAKGGVSVAVAVIFGIIYGFIIINAALTINNTIKEIKDRSYNYSNVIYMDYEL